MSDHIEERARKIVHKHLGLSWPLSMESITSSARFVDDLHADSLDNIKLIMAFEEEFGIEIPDDVYEQTQTFGEAVAFVRSCLAKERG